LPSFTSQVPDLQDTGAILEARIDVTDEERASIASSGRLVHGPVDILAVVDTGASNTVVQIGLAQSLGLEPIGTRLMNTPSSSRFECLEYNVRIVLPNDVGFQLPVLEAPLEDQNIQCMIGRDILSQAVLVYIGYNNQFTLSF
jgi:predicted aspartyl protease